MKKMRFSRVFYTLPFRILRFLDRILLVRSLTYQQYERVHTSLSFPLVRLAFAAGTGYLPNLKNPSTFNELLLSERLFNRSPLTPVLSDKLAVRDFVASKIDRKHLIPLYACHPSYEALVSSDIPSNCVIKMNHSSGQLLINRNGDDISRPIKKFKSWFVDKYRFQELMWFNQSIKRQAVIEELLLTKEGKVPADYKFFMFGGKLEFVQVDSNRFTGHTRTLFDKEWNCINVKYLYPPGPEVDRPARLNLMISIAEKLSEDFPFMRVDLYDVEGDVYFGELTSFPSAGYAEIQPFRYDKQWGRKLMGILQKRSRSSKNV